VSYRWPCWLPGLRFPHMTSTPSKVPNRLEFLRVQGEEGWPTISVSCARPPPLIRESRDDGCLIDRHSRATAKPFPDGRQMARCIGTRKRTRRPPVKPLQPSTQSDVGFMVKDSKRLCQTAADGAMGLHYDAATDTFTPAPWRTSPTGKRCQVWVRGATR